MPDTHACGKIFSICRQSPVLESDDVATDSVCAVPGLNSPVFSIGGMSWGCMGVTAAAFS